MKINSATLKILAVVTFIAMVTVNAMANILPINGVTTGEVSDSYANLFAPAGFTFSIWGIIYLLLAAYTYYQFQSDKDTLLKQINKYYIASSLINSAWIFAWHYDLILTTVVLMILLLYCLIKIADLTRESKLKGIDNICIRLPFSVYFGWITVATIANVTVFLVSIGWNGFGIAEPVWAAVVIAVGAIIGVLRILKDRSIAYGMVIVWAYIGIIAKHISAEYYTGAYPLVIATAAISAVSVAITSLYSAIKKTQII